MNKAEKQERLFDITQLAKAIFVKRAASLNFYTDRELNIPTIVDECFKDAEMAFDGQERYVKNND